MQWSDVQFNPPARVLRQFAGAGFVALSALACWRGLARGETTLAAACAAGAAALAVAGLARPSWLRLPYVAATVAAFPIGWLLSWVVLGLVYLGVFTPTALAFRLLGRDPLHRRSPPRADTYWSPKPAPADAGRYLKTY